MKKEIEIPDGCEAKIVGNKVVFVTKESEDEKIREALLEYFNERNSYRDEDETFNGIPFPSIIAYLEKQKDEAQKQFNLGVQAGKEEVLYEMEKEQKPAEWSEEDENYYDTIVRKLQVIGDDSGLTMNQIDFLDKHRPQPHWKPGEEQFQGLRRAIIKAEKGSDAWNSLTDLYEHLKKL